MRRSGRARLLAAYVERARLLGWILFLLSVIVIIIGSAIMEPPWGTVVVAFGGALVPAAVVNAGFDPLLREQAANDIHAVFKIHESVTKHGLVAMEAGLSFDLTDVLRRSTDVQAMPLSPRSWRDRDFPSVLTVARERPIAVSVYLPSPDDDICAMIARRDRGDADATRRELIVLPDLLTQAWDEAQVHPGSRLEVLYYAGVPGFGAMCTDNQALIELGAAAREDKVGRQSYVIAFDGRADTHAWLKRQLSFAAYEDLPPSSAGIRPLPPATETGFDR